LVSGTAIRLTYSTIGKTIRKACESNDAVQEDEFEMEIMVHAEEREPPIVSNKSVFREDDILDIVLEGVCQG